MTKYQKLVDKLTKEREEEIKRNYERFAEIKRVISTWPEWKQKCDFYIIKK